MVYLEPNTGGGGRCQLRDDELGRCMREGRRESTSEAFLHLAELPVVILQLHALVQVKVFSPQVEQFLAVHANELLLAGEEARADLEDREWVLASAWVLLDLECITGERQHLFLDDQFDGMLVIEKVAADGRADGYECHVGALLLCRGSYSRCSRMVSLYEFAMCKTY